MCLCVSKWSEQALEFSIFWKSYVSFMYIHMILIGIKTMFEFHGGGGQLPPSPTSIASGLGI